MVFSNGLFKKWTPKSTITMLNKLIEINASQKYQVQNIIKQIDIANNPINHLLVFVTK